MTIATSPADERVSGIMNPVARLQFGQAQWLTGAGHAALTRTIKVSGTIYRMDVIITSVTDNPTVNITAADDNGIAFGTELDHSGLADGTNHYFDSESSTDGDGDFNPVTHHGDITLTIDPSADPGGAAQILNVDVLLYVR